MKSLPIPVTVDYDNLAAGLLELFTDEERTILRFGMLPAKKIECLEKNLREKFMEDFELKSREDDMYLSLSYDEERRADFVEFKMDDLVSAISHNISLKLYEIGDLVV